MKKLACVLALAVVFAMGAGCAGKVNTDITPPTDYTIEDSRIFNNPYDVVWKAVVQSIGSSFFVLDNIEKDSGIMTLSFSTQKPGDYIDCGTIHDYGTVQMRKYDLKIPGTANNVVRKFVTTDGLVGQTFRTCSLSGKSNILVQSLSSKETKVSVKTRYVFTLINNAQLIGGYPQKAEDIMHFTGNEIGRFDSPKSIECRSKGVLEKIILDDIAKHL